MREELPLLSRTPDNWAAMALRDPLALLSDHAYLEKKAAANAVELLNRWPEPSRPEEWTQTLAAIASDEAAHLSGVVRLLTERGGRLDRAHRNDYARQLRQHVRKGRGQPGTPRPSAGVGPHRTEVMRAVRDPGSSLRG